MDAWLVQRFANEQRAALEGAAVRRAVVTADGLILALQAGGAEIEVGFAMQTGAAWAWVLHARARHAMHEEIERVSPELAGDASRFSPLDALRAWLLRPAPQQPGWSALEGARVVEMEALGGDRILVLRFDKEDAVGRSMRVTLTAQLFDRGGNLRLVNASGEELANRFGRAPAKAHAGKSQAPPIHDFPSISLAGVACIELTRSSARELLAVHRRALRRQESRLARLVEKLERESSESQAAEEQRRLGELLSANLHRVRRGQSRVTVHDLYDAGKKRDIELDPRLSPQENVALFFKRARRGERGRAKVTSKLAETRTALDELRDKQSSLQGELDWAEGVSAAAETWRESCAEIAASTPAALWTPGGPIRKAAREVSVPAEARGPGRSFVLGEGWEVRVGRSNAENDELTHRFAHSEDVWMHASGAPGSHVVLRMRGRTDNPPREILEAAAAIAAHFSKARHSKTVPVIWTRKRHVRKPRGSKPGLATCTHEKTIFVKPSLPSDKN